MRTVSTTRNPESGYALLYVFAMASMVAIALYEQVPRAAFEAQREKEQLLINHGEQYKRGVQLYVRKLGRYPANLSDLDNTQSIRFLRKHYFDPMTGKEEWRLLHMGPAGKLIDSKIESADASKDQWHAGSITEFKSAGSSDYSGTENANIATRKRPSDEQIQPGMQGGMMPGTLTDPNLAASAGSPPPNPGAGGAPADPNAPPKPSVPPSYLNGGALPGMPIGQRGVSANLNNLVQNGTMSNASSAANAAQASVSGNGGFGSSISGNGGFGAPVNSQTGGVSPTPINPNSGFGNPNSGFGNNPNGGPPGAYPTSGYNPANPNGFPQPGTNPTAANMIQNLLTSPRPGGAPPGAMNGTVGVTVMGGFAGVASTFKGSSVIRYNDQNDYTKWEFFYDYNAEATAAAKAAMPPQTKPPGTPVGAPSQ